MKIIKQLIEKKLEFEEMYAKAMRRQFSFEEHLSAYQMALMYLGYDNPNYEKELKIWNTFISSTGETQMRFYKKLISFSQEHHRIIVEALVKMDKAMKEEIALAGTKLYKPFTWGCLAFEFDTFE